jgi:hypothetical protein
MDVPLVAVSPQVPERLREIRERHALDFTVASDLDNAWGGGWASSTATTSRRVRPPCGRAGSSATSPEPGPGNCPCRPRWSSTSDVASASSTSALTGCAHRGRDHSRSRAALPAGRPSGLTRPVPIRERPYHDQFSTAARFSLLAGAAAHRGPATPVPCRGGPDLSKVTLRIGDQTGATRSKLQAAGLLKDVPYNIDWSVHAAAVNLHEALKADAIDIGSANDSPTGQCHRRRLAHRRRRRLVQRRRRGAADAEEQPDPQPGRLARQDHLPQHARQRSALLGGGGAAAGGHQSG